MFRKLLGINNNNQSNKPKTLQEKPDDLFALALAEKKKEDPMAGVKLGAIEVSQCLMKALNKSGQGIHVESLLTAIAALGGFSCQMAIREELIHTGQASEREVFMIIEVDNGGRFYTGEALSKPLIEDRHSIWHMVADAIRHDVLDLPNIAEVVTYSISSLGTGNFAVPRVCQDTHGPHSPPQDYLRDLWPVILPVVDRFCARPLERPILFGMCLHRLIAQSKQIVPPVVAATIVMDVALAMAKIDPSLLWVDSGSEARQA